MRVYSITRVYSHQPRPVYLQAQYDNNNNTIYTVLKVNEGDEIEKLSTK